MVIIISLWVVLSLIYFVCYIYSTSVNYSEAVKLIKQLNKKFIHLYLIKYSAPYVEFEHTVKSKKELEDFDFNAFVMQAIIQNESLFINHHNDYLFYKEASNTYLREFNAIISECTPSDYFKDSSFCALLKRVELRICSGLKYPINEKPFFRIKAEVTYVSPARRNFYAESKLYTSDEVIDIFRMFVRNTPNLRQIGVSLHPKKMCDKCSLYIKRKSYDWEVDGVLICACPSCNRSLEKTFGENRKNNHQINSVYRLLHHTDEGGRFNYERFNNKDNIQDETANGDGVSVTKFVKKTSQPRGGYLSLKSMDVIEFKDEDGFVEGENIHPSLVGLAVDCMTRFMFEKNAEKAFSVSLRGALIVGEKGKAFDLVSMIAGLDETSIRSACKLVGYDCAYRAGISSFKGVDKITPDDKTVSNIKIMVKRSLNCFSIYGGLIDTGMTFEGGYTNVISKGDADFLTKNTIWDMKVSKREPTIQHTFQIVIYYLLLSKSPKYSNFCIENVGIFNPRSNKAYVCGVARIDDLELITEICGFSS